MLLGASAVGPRTVQDSRFPQERCPLAMKQLSILAKLSLIRARPFNHCYSRSLTVYPAAAQLALNASGS
jgi:hypothetical protein